MRSTPVVMTAVLVLTGVAVAQIPVSPSDSSPETAIVHLEPHNGQTRFRMGDPIVVDLVFAGGSPSDVVVSAVNPYLPSPDQVDLEPVDGWVRTHPTTLTQVLTASPTHFSGAPIRVPILLNRDVRFLYAMHYELRVTTERLRTQTPTGFLPGRCSPCTTNALDLDILPMRDPADEAALVAKLSGALDQMNGEATDLKTTSEVEAERRNDAQQLAYLPGDDALRAKVQLIAADPENGADATPISPILVDGLPSTQDKTLQLDLLEDAWQDPHRVPTSILQSALRQAKQLMHSFSVTPDGQVWAGDNDQRQAALEENRREIDEIEATLDLRTPENRAATLLWLKAQAAPNQFNHRQLPLVGQ